MEIKPLDALAHVNKVCANFSGTRGDHELLKASIDLIARNIEAATHAVSLKLENDLLKIELKKALAKVKQLEAIEDERALGLSDGKAVASFSRPKFIPVASADGEVTLNKAD